MIAIFISAIAAYLLGSINTSIFVSKLMGASDIRNHGSGNAGATNTLRIMGKKAAALVVLGDALKGVFAILFARLAADFANAGNICEYVAAVFVVVGHVFPLYFGFRGGKGIMTSIAVIFTLDPAIGGILVAVFAAVLVCFNYVSLASVIASVCFPVCVLLLHGGNNEFFVSALIITFITVAKHHTNISRLIKGTESKLFKNK